VSPTVFIFGCVALVAAVLFSNLCAYKFGKYQGWMELLRKHTKYQRKHIAISEGETLVAVIEITRGSYIFVRNNEEDKKSYE
jgi:hypothetical protein